MYLAMFRNITTSLLLFVTFIVISNICGGSLFARSPWECCCQKKEMEQNMNRSFVEFVFETVSKDGVVILIFMILGGIIGNLLARVHILRRQISTIRHIRKITHLPMSELYNGRDFDEIN